MKCSTCNDLDFVKRTLHCQARRELKKNKFHSDSEYTVIKLFWVSYFKSYTHISCFKIHFAHSSEHRYRSLKKHHNTRLHACTHTYLCFAILLMQASINLVLMQRSVEKHTKEYNAFSASSARPSGSTCCKRELKK